MADKNSLADADLIGRILPGMDSSLSALFTGESLSRASFLPSNSEESFTLAGSSGFSPSHRSFSLHDHVLSDGLLGFSPVHLTPERVVLSTPKCLASCKSVQFYDTTVSLLPSELKLVQNCGSVSVSGRGVSRRAKSESPTRRPGLSVANIAAGTSSSGTGYKIPKVSKVAQPKTAQPTPDVRGFSSDDDSAANDTDSDEDHPDHSSSSSSRDSDDDSYRLTDKKSKRKRKMSRDKELLDGSHSMFDPSGDKRSKLSKVQDTYVRKMFTKLIKAEDIEDSFTALGMEKSSSSLLQVRNLDPDLLDILPGASFVAKADKSFTAVEGRVLRAATLALTLWEELQAAREGNSDSVDVNKLITLAEAAVCCIGQASVELKFQRRLAVAGKILKDRKKAKVVLAQNEEVLEREKKYLFGTAFTSKLVKKITRQNKLKETLKKVGGQKPFKKGKVRSNPGKPFKNFGRFADSSPQQQPFRGAPEVAVPTEGAEEKDPKNQTGTSPPPSLSQNQFVSPAQSGSGLKVGKSKELSENTVFLIKQKALAMLFKAGFKPVVAPPKHGGRIQAYIQNWRILTQDQWILDVVQGKKINWVSVPFQTKEPKELRFSQEVSKALDGEVLKMVEMGVIEPCQNTAPQFISTLFLRNKKDGSVRPIINLKHLNQFTEYQHFKMEGIPALIDTIQERDFMYKIDLSNAYWTVPLHFQDRKWMKFHWRGKLYQFLEWPFGLGPVPRWFTKLLKPVIAFLRRQGTRNVIYMDDLWGGESDLEASVLHISLTVTLLELLGFVVNLKKSILDPTQVLKDYLGFIINSVEMSLSLPLIKIQKIQQACRDLLQKKTVSVRALTKVLGQLVATARAVFPAPLHYRKLQMTQIATLLKSQRQYSAKLQLNQECKHELAWWIENLNDWNGKSFITTVPPGALTIETDASNVGWGAVCKGISTQGQWKKSETRMHINEKELLAASLAIKAFTKDKHVSHVHLKTDNTTTVSQIQKMGSTRSKSLFNLTTDLWKYCLDNKIMLTAEHLPGTLNTIADRESRMFTDSSNWMLNKEIFKMIMNQFGPAEIDLFADRTNHQLKKYISWKPDPTALKTDAFTVKWNGFLGYAFPPICLIGRCLAKVRAEHTNLIIITPTWQGQP